MINAQKDLLKLMKESS